MPKSTDTNDSLKRLGGGRWQTRDERFTIEPQSGTWMVVDGEQSDDLGLPLVRGPFGSLGAAKEAIAVARGAEPTVSPLAAQVAKLRERPPAPPAKTDDRRRKGTAPAAKPKPAGPEQAAQAEPQAEPRWMRDLDHAERRRAHQLVARLAEAGASDPEGIARRDVVGEVPAAAAFSIARAMTALGPEASPTEVARLLVDGRDAALGVRWRLVDGDGRSITLDVDAIARRSK